MLTIGAVSERTLRPEDLAQVYEGFIGEHGNENQARWMNENKPDGWDEGELADPEELQDWLDEVLVPIMCDLAPPFCHFGAHEGDGACFGCWIDEDAIRDARHDAEIYTIGPKDDPPEFILRTNDHGNMTLYRIKLEQVWSVV